jgi:hypothetical protein
VQSDCEVRKQLGEEAALANQYPLIETLRFGVAAWLNGDVPRRPGAFSHFLALEPMNRICRAATSVRGWKMV